MEPQNQDIKYLSQSKNSPNPLLIVAIIFTAIVGGIFLLTANNKKIEAPGKDIESIKMPETQKASGTQATSSQGEIPTQKLASKPTDVFVGDDFVLKMPTGWNSAATMPGTVATVFNTAENNSTNPTAAKINFKSYITVTFVINNKTLDQTIADLQAEIAKQITKPSFSKSQDIIIDGQPGKTFEASFNKDGVDFVVLLGLTKSPNKTFIISGYTLSERWAQNKDIFYQAIKNFQFAK